MNNPDHLTEFEKFPKMPKSYTAILVLSLLVVAIHTFLLYPSLKYNLFGRGEMLWWQGYFYALFIIYPLIGAFGYERLKKFGWFIFSHYTLSSVLMALLVLFNDEGITDSRIILLIFSGLFSLISISLLFHKQSLIVFELQPSHIFLAILLTIFFPIIHLLINLMFFN